MRDEAQGARSAGTEAYIKKYVEVTSTAQRSDSHAQTINQSFHRGDNDMITRREFVAGVAGTAIAGKLAGQESGMAKKENLVASCGLYCGACPMYLATQENDEQRMASIQKQFGGGALKLSQEDLLCDGCLGGGRLASFCRKCAIRESAFSKTGTKRCSECAEYACSRITDFNNDGMLHHAEVLENLRQLREMGIKDWAKHEEDRWRCPKCGTMFSWYDPECPKCKAPRSARLFPLKKA